jgi:autotransporter passenger strand-loop-strand repeat protein
VSNASVTSGQSPSGLVVGSGNSLYIESGGEADATLVSGGALFVESGGIASGSLVSAGGAFIVSAGGTAFATVLSGDGSTVNQLGGTVFNTVVEIDGIDFVDGGTDERDRRHRRPPGCLGRRRVRHLCC